MRGLLDTSVFIAMESGREMDYARLPDDSLVSVVTVAELYAGVLAAADVTTRAVRMGTLNMTSDVELLGVDEEVARTWSLLRAYLAEAKRRVNVNDLWIAATAATHGLPVVTQDDDFGPVEGIGGLEVIRV